MHFAQTLSPGTSLRYALWRAAGRRRPLPVRLRNGIRFILRPPSAENGDYGVAYEIFVLRYYDPPPAVDLRHVRNVVDLGGNVGLSVLHWLNAFPACRVEVFEPHPLHLAQMRRNLALGGVAHRVTVYGKAAGTAEGRLRLSREGTSSSTLDDPDDGHAVEATDILAHLAGRRTDLLKMDIEGGEYAILADDRLGDLDIGCIVMEWHGRHPGNAERTWCESRLTECGYVIHPIFAKADHGMFWAVRPGASAARQGHPGEES